MVHYIESLGYTEMSRRQYRANKKTMKLTIGDAKLVVIAKNSIFKDYFNVAIVCFRLDSNHGMLAREELSKGKTHLVHKRALELASTQSIIDIKNQYSYTAQNYIKNILKEEGKGYDLNNFQWVGR